MIKRDGSPVVPPVEHLFEPDCQDRPEVAVKETNVEVDGIEIFVWAAVDCEILEVLHVGVTPGRSSLDGLFFLRDVLQRCRSRPLSYFVDHSPLLFIIRSSKYL